VSIRNRYALIEPVPPPFEQFPRDETLVRLEDGTGSLQSHPGDATDDDAAHEDESMAVASRASGGRDAPGASMEPEVDMDANPTMNARTVESSWISVQDNH
jgi:hypothetical protein